MAWTNSNRQVYNLTCPGSVVYQCPTTLGALMVSGELFIGINFTAIALAFKNSTEREQSLHGNTGPMLIRFQYVRERIPTIMERIPAISECSHLGNPRYHTHTNYDEREESSSRTPKSRSRCTKYLSGSLIVCPV